MESLQLVPFVNEAGADAADFVELLLVVDHVRTAQAGDGVVLAEENGLLGADFLTHAAVDAANHVDVELERPLLDLCPWIVGRDFRGDDLDRFRRADEFAELAGNAAFTALFVGDEGWRRSE